MIYSDDVARSFDDRPGFNLVDFEEVGLPIYRLTSTVLTLMPKAYNPIEEFVLRAIDAGLSRVPSIAGLLGISEQIVEGTASSLIKDDDLVVDSAGELRLTRKSERVLAGESTIRPREQSLVFYFDALTRRPLAVDDLRLLEPHHLKSKGIREIRSYPPKRPRPEDVRGDELQTALRGPAQSSDQSPQILQVKTITRAYNYFIPAIALIYKRAAGAEIQVAFAVDGRLSQEHESAFAACDGPSRIGITGTILNPESHHLGSVDPLLPKAAAKKVLSVSRAKGDVGSVVGATEPAIGADRPVEMVAVYDHPPLLRDALNSAKRQLIIVSPWITEAVVDSDFLAALESRLQRGVSVHIGYGLGPEEGPPGAIRKLQKLAGQFQNFQLVRLGDTHAKILIKDEDWLVTTSFNWLSFRGDPKRAFREEWGTRIAISDQVREQAQRILQRLSSAQAVT